MIRLIKYQTFDGKLWSREDVARQHTEVKIGSVKSKISHMITGLSFANAQDAVDELRAHYKELAYLEKSLEVVDRTGLEHDHD